MVGVLLSGVWLFRHVWASASPRYSIVVTVGGVCQGGKEYLDKPHQPLSKRARIGVMQKDWVKEGMPRSLGQSLEGEKSRLGWEPALVRPAGRVSVVVAGASVGACSCSSGGFRSVVGLGPVASWPCPEPPPNGTRRTNRSRLPTEAPATTTETRSRRTNKSSLPTEAALSPSRTDPNNAAFLPLPSPSASPRYGPSLKAVGGVCQGTLSRLDGMKGRGLPLRWSRADTRVA